MESSESQASATDDSPQNSPPSSRLQRWWPGLLLLLALLCGGGGFALWRLLNPSNPPQATAQKPQGVPVKLQKVETSTIEQSSQYVGNLEAQQEIILRPKTAGRVTQVFASPGEIVEQGTPIVELSPERTQAELNAALANVRASRAARQNAQAQLQAIEAERASAAADVELQRENFRRTQFLASQGAQSRQALDQARRDLEAAQAALNAATERVEAARASLEQAQAAQAQAQAQAAAARQDLEDKNIVAPIAGVVGDIPVKIGDYVSIGDPLTTITQNQALELEFSVPIEQADQLRVGLPVELRTAQGDEPIVTGQISFVSPQVNANSQEILAQARFPNPQGRLRDQQYVKATVIWDKYSGVLIPTTAVSRIGGQTFVYLASQPEQPGASQLVAQQKPVELGNIQGNYYQVISGVEPGDTIVTSGLLNLSDGAPIMPASPASPASPAPPATS